MTSPNAPTTARYAVALAAFQAGDDTAPEVVAARADYQEAGGFEAQGFFSAFLARQAV